MRDLDIVALGEPLAEFNQIRPGEPEHRFGFGGDTSNVVIAAARSGARTAYASAVGDDAFGRAFLDLWAREGVETSGVRVDPAAPTGAYFITHGPEGHAFTYRREGSAASRLGPADCPHGLIARAAVLHVSGISQAISSSACDLVFAAIDAARAAGTTVAYDTNLRLRLWPLPRARAIIHAALAMSDIALPGLDDARQLTGLADADAIADLYLRGGCYTVAMTLGREGALVATATGRERIPSIAVEARDASGAGDCFDGAFLAEWVRHRDPFRAARYAVVAAALSTTGYGAVAPIPRREAVLAAMPQP